jgi:serine/threonine-protein kinase
LNKHLQEAQLPDIWPVDVPNGVRSVLKKALSKNPEDRYENINEFLKHLEEDKSQRKTTSTFFKNTKPEIIKDTSKTQANEMQLKLPGGLMMTFLRVPAGKFLMGALEDDKEAEDDEKPHHKVYLDEYWIGETPVTNAQYKAYKKNHQYPHDKSDHPVTQISWYDAYDFCTWLTTATGQKILLPTEAEWEKAARGTDGRLYPWGNQVPKKRFANFENAKTTPVGKYPKDVSPYGVLDMAGNVSEWCADWYDEAYYYQSGISENPQGASSGEQRVLRGGSWGYSKVHLRVSARGGYFPDGTSYYWGFRCICLP